MLILYIGWSVKIAVLRVSMDFKPKLTKLPNDGVMH